MIKINKNMFGAKFALFSILVLFLIIALSLKKFGQQYWMIEIGDILFSMTLAWAIVSIFFGVLISFLDFMQNRKKK